MQTYRVAYIKTYFDNMVFPYLTPEEMNIEAGKMYLVNSKFGEEIGRAMSGVKYITLEQFPLKRPASQQNHEDLDNLNHKLVDIEGVDLANLIKEEAASDTLVVEEGIEKKIENFRILREASEQEVDEWEKLNKNNKDRAFNDALKFIKELNLPMRLISVHFLYQKKKVIFNFTAENRVDFRELVKKLAAIYKTRIEMRQIGVRDASKILGGCGVCGIQLCCTRSNCHINSIYLKMAKDQGFAVSSSKLTGVCGRLMCCLAYEADFYAQEREKYPPLNSLIQDSSKSYRVVSYNFIKGEIIGEDENHHLKKFELEKLKFVTATESDAKVYVVESE
jgi:cell fate regulator YaaT (PSP1 superfamily)